MRSKLIYVYFFESSYFVIIFQDSKSVQLEKKTLKKIS